MADGKWSVAEETPMAGSQWDVVSETTLDRKQKKPAGVEFSDRIPYYLNQVAKLPGQIASIPGLAVDATNSAIGLGEQFLRAPERQADAITRQPSQPNKFPVDRPFGGSESIRNAFDEMLGVQNINPPSLMDKYLGLGIELGGTGAPFSAKNIASATKKVPAIASEIASLMAGTSGGIYGEQLGGDTGKAIGVAVGGAGSSLGPWSAGKVGDKFSAESRRAGANKAAGAMLKPAIESNLKSGENMEQAQSITDAINAATGRGKPISPVAGTPFEPKEPSLTPEFSPTLGARTNAPMVRDMESDIATKTPESLGRYSIRNQQNQEALDTATNALLGQKNADDLPRQSDSRLIGAKSKLDARMAQAEKQQKAIAANVDRGEAQGVGEKLRDQYWNTRQSVSAKFKKGYADLYDSADRAGVAIDMKDVRDAAAKIAGADQNVYQDMPRTFGKIKREMGGAPELPYPKPQNILQQSANDKAIAAAQSAGDKVSFREFHSLWKEVGDELAAAARTGDTKRYGYLKQLKESLDGKLAQLESGGLGDVSGQFRDINKAYGTQYAKVFKEGIGGRIADVGKFGATTDDAKIVEKFFTPDGLDDFSRIYGADKDAQKFLKDGVLGMFAKRAIDENTGKIKRGAAESFRRQHAEALGKLPEVDALLRNTTKLDEALTDRLSRLDAAKRSLDKSVLKTVAGTEDVASLIDKAAKSPKEMRQLFAIAKGKEQRAAIARTLADELPRIARKAGVEPYQYLLSQEENLKPIIDQIGPNHWANLKTIAGGQTLQSRAPIPGSVNAPPNKGPVESLTGTSAYGGWAVYRNVIRGRSSIEQELVGVAGKLGIKVKADMATKVLDDAIYDPELADALAKMANGRATPAASDKLGHWLKLNAFRTAVVAGDENRKE